MNEQSNPQERAAEFSANEARDRFDIMNKGTMIGGTLLAGLASGVLIYSHFHDAYGAFASGFIALLYFVMVEWDIIKLTYGLTNTFSTKREIWLAYGGLVALVGTILFNSIVHFAKVVSTYQPNALINWYLTWGMVIVPVAVLVLAQSLHFANPKIRQQRLELRSTGESKATIAQAKNQAFKTAEMADTKAFIAGLEAKRLRLKYLQDYRTQLPSELHPVIDIEIKKLIGETASAGIVMPERTFTPPAANDYTDWENERPKA